MGRRNSNDWSVFGLSGDPVPGDVSLVTELGHMFTSRETAAYEVRVGVNALCTDPGVYDWLGRSGDAFRNTLSPLPRLLGQMVDAYSEAAAALDKYATALGQAQSVADSAYQRRMAAVNDWSAKNGGQRPPLKTGGSNLDGWVVAPEGVDVQGWYQQQTDVAETAVPARSSALAACLKAMQAADEALARVQAALMDTSFTDFNTQFVAKGGSLTDLSPPGYSPVELLGSALYSGEVNDLNAVLAGGKTDADPDVIRAELADLTSQYKDDADFWQSFAPSLGAIPGWLQKHPGSDGTDDGQLLNVLGERIAAAASGGSLLALSLTGQSSANLIGLSKLLASTDGQEFQPPLGVEFLSDLTRTYINRQGSLGTYTGEDFGSALSSILDLTAGNPEATRLVLSGPDGVDLVTKLLHGSASVTYELTGRGMDGRKLITTGWPGVDPNAISAFLDSAASPVDPAHPDTRTNSPADLQRVQAAYNVATAVAAFENWRPPDSIGEHADGVTLPSAVTTSLAGYAKAFSYDLAVSVSDKVGTGAGISTADGNPGGPPAFALSDEQATDFLKVALADPTALGDYKGFAEGQYQNAVKVAIMTNGGLDRTLGYANLVASAQQAIDNQQLTAAQHQDATAAQGAALVNGLLGGLGNAPSGPVGGVGQAVDGLLAPYIDQLPAFDTSHAAAAAAANHQADLLIGGQANVSVTQAALDAGALTNGPDPAHMKPQIPVGIVDGNGKVQANTQFRFWFTGTGTNEVVIPESSKHGETSLGSYVQQLTTAMNGKMQWPAN